MRTRSFSILISIMLLMVILILPSGLSAPDPEFEPDAGVDVPVWKVGDHWNYTTEVEYVYMDLFPITLNGWMNFSVVALTLDMFSSGEPVYITNITGNISGEETFPFVGDVNIYIDLTGYIWNRAQDLSMYRSILNATVKGTVSAINGNYPFGYEYSPSLEEYDFPLISGEEWKVRTAAKLPFGASGDLVSLEQNVSCGDVMAVTVPAGTFDCYPVAIDGTDSQFYNATVGQTVKRSFSLDDLVEGLVIPFELTSYFRGDYSVDVDLSIVEDQQVEMGETFTVHGELSTSNVMVNIFFPGGVLAGTQMLALGDTDFDEVLTTPVYPDNTPTNMDFGSFGIFVVVNFLDDTIPDGTGVVTVTTKGRDLELTNDSLNVDVLGDGTIDDNVSANITIYNPSNFRVDNFSAELEVLDSGLPIVGFINLSLDGRSRLSLEHQFRVDTPGEYTVVLRVDPGDYISEYNETNNEVSVNFTLLERPDILWDVDPSGGNYSIDEGDDIDLHGYASRGGAEIPGIWFRDGVEVTSSSDLSFVSTFDGANSSRSEPFVFEYILDQGLVFPGEIDRIPFNITVLDVNRPHVIDSFEPSKDIVNVSENSTIMFSVNASDPDGDVLEYIWTVGNTTFTSGSNISIDTDHLGNYSSDHSPLSVSVVIHDGRDDTFNLTVSWSLEIIDVDRPFEVELNPMPGNLTVEFGDVLTITFEATDPDGTEVLSEWSYPGHIIPQGNVTSINFDHQIVGLGGGDSFNVNLTLTSGEMTVTYWWFVEIGEESIIPQPDPVPVPPEGVSILSPVMDETFYTDEYVVLRAESTDTRNLTYTWTIGDQTLTGTEVLLDPMDPGNYTIHVNVSSIDEDSPGWIEISIDFTVKEPVQVEDPAVEDEEDSDPWMIYVIVIIIVLLVVVIMIILFARRRSEYEFEE